MADYNGIEALLASTDNLVQLVNNTGHDDDTLTFEGVDWFKYNGVAAKSIYVSGNSWLGFGTNTSQLYVCQRDCKLWNFWREEGTLFNYYKFLRLKWDGYSAYSSTGDDVRLTYEVYLFSTGDIFLNVLRMPTNANYLGTSQLVCTGGTKALIVTAGQALQETFTHASEDGSDFTAATGLIDIKAPYDRKYLVSDKSGKYYTVDAGALKEVTAEETYISVSGITLQTALWVKPSYNLVLRDTGNARTYVFPLQSGGHYRITLTEIGDRERIATTASDPTVIEAGGSVSTVRIIKNADPVLGDVVEFTAASNEAWCVVHVSSDGTEPKTAIEKHISALVNLFKTSGVEERPSGSLLLPLTDPVLLFWQDSLDPLPILEADVTAMPFPQTVLTENVDMTDSTILGIEKVTADSDDNTLFAVSFDGGTTWWNYVDNAWAQLSEAQSGMTKTALADIGTDAWALKATTGHYMFRFILFEGSYVNSIVVDYLN